MGFPGGSVAQSHKESTSQAADMGSIPDPGRFPGGGNGNPLEYTCPGNPMDRGAWWATVPGVAKESDTTWRLSSNNNNYFITFLK